MSTGVRSRSRAVLIAVTCLSMAAAASLTNVAASLWGLSGGRLAGPFGTGLLFLPGNALLTMAIAGALAGALALVVIYRMPDSGWTWLLVAGSVLTAALTLLDFTTAAPNRELLQNWAFLSAVGAGPVLVLIGLLGAGNWLTHAAATGAGAAVAGLALAAPVPGTVLLYTFVTAQPPDLDSWRSLTIGLAIVGIAGAFGAAAVSLSLSSSRTGPTVPSPSPKVTAIGALAALLPAVPVIVVRIWWDELPSVLANPEDPFRANNDRWTMLVGLSGLAIFAVAVGLAAALGPKALGAALAGGLVLYGVELPVVLAAANPLISAGKLVTVALGLAVGIAAAISRWRAWVAGTACAVAGIVIVVSLTVDHPAELVATVVLLMCAVAAVSTYASAADALAEGTQAPAVLGALAVAIHLGLVNSETLLRHSALSVSPTTLIAAGGVALLVAALLVLALRAIRTPEPDQAMPSPELVR